MTAPPRTSDGACEQPRPNQASRWLLRLGTADDLAALAELERACFPEPWTAEALRWGLTESSVSLLVLSERTAPERILAYLLQRGGIDDGEILRIAVAPEARRTGLASTLLAAGLDRLRRRGIRHCLLEVRSDNRPALRLYRRFGFRVVGRRRHYYRNGSEAVVCARDLDPASSLNPGEGRCYGFEAQERDAASPSDHAGSGAFGARRSTARPASRDGGITTSRASRPAGAESSERKENRLMSRTDEALRQQLLETHDEFRALFERHQDCERRLDELRLKSVLSEEDELEEKQIKRQKLFLKDQMEAILRSRRETGVSA